MPVAERTYSFRAPASLGEDLLQALQNLEVIDEDDPAYEDLVHEFARRLAHWERSDVEKTQSAVMRSIFQLLIAAVETVHENRRYASEFAALAQERTVDEEAFAQAALASATVLWRDA